MQHRLGARLFNTSYLSDRPPGKDVAVVVSSVLTYGLAGREDASIGVPVAEHDVAIELAQHVHPLPGNKPSVGYIPGNHVMVGSCL